MRIIPVGMLAFVLAACSSSAPTNLKSASTERIFSRAQTMSFSDGEYRCVSPQHPDQALRQKYPDCTGIPVLALMTSSGPGCLAVVPYHTLHIYSGKKKTKVEWQLFGPTGYEFDPSTGIDLRPHGGGNSPSQNYEGKEKNSNKFKWDLKENAAPDTFDHDAVVIGPNGPCEKFDPLIVNSDN